MLLPPLISCAEKWIGFASVEDDWRMQIVPMLASPQLMGQLVKKNRCIACCAAVVDSIPVDFVMVVAFRRMPGNPM